MSSLLGTFQSCGNGNHSTSITYSGTSCTAIQQIPGLTSTNTTSRSMTCTNRAHYPSNSNLSSSFAISGSCASITQAHNITVNGHNFTFHANGANFLNNTASVYSVAYPSAQPSLKFMVFICLLLFGTQALATSGYLNGAHSIIERVGQRTSIPVGTTVGSSMRACPARAW